MRALLFILGHSLGVILSLCTGTRAECCLDKDVAYTGKQLLDKADAGDQYFRQILNNRCRDGLKEKCDLFPELSWDPVCRQIAAGTLEPQFYFRCTPNYACYMSHSTPCENFDRRSFRDAYFCKDGNPRVGSYCSRGTCNMFGCNCDGGCIERPGKRRLLSDSSESSNKSTVAKCQEKVTSMYNTMALREKDQILAYYNCLDTVSDRILDENDAVIQELENTLNGTARLKAMDSNGNDGIEPSEFDSGLDDNVSPQSSGWSMTGVPITYLIVGMILLVIR